MIKKAVKTLAKLFPFTKKELVVLALSIIVLFFGPLAPVVIRFVLTTLLLIYFVRKLLVISDDGIYIYLWFTILFSFNFTIKLIALVKMFK